jgi:hypothetical protein
MIKDEAQRSLSALLRAVSMSNGRWTFYEAVSIKSKTPPTGSNELISGAIAWSGHALP